MTQGQAGGDKVLALRSPTPILCTPSYETAQPHHLLQFSDPKSAGKICSGLRAFVTEVWGAAGGGRKTRGFETQSKQAISLLLRPNDLICQMAIIKQPSRPVCRKNSINNIHKASCTWYVFGKCYCHLPASSPLSVPIQQ